MQDAIIILDRLSCERDGRILFSDMSLSFGAGDIVQVAGPNGSGKTTLLRLLSTISGDHTGDIRYRGDLLNPERPDFLDHLLYIGHTPGIKKTLTPLENLQWYFQLHGGRRDISATEALAEVGLRGYESVPCYQLSAGQLRRVALARLYLTSALVWILDEPFTAIDQQGIAKLEALLADHASGGGLVILTTHQPLSLPDVRQLQLEDYAREKDCEC